MRNLPTGTITLLFTDIEGSTSLLQQLGSRYADVLKECQHLLRTAFQQWNGSEVDTQGDAFFVVFARATDAVAAAVDAQRALAAHAWPAGVTVPVRMGIHTGEPQHSSEGYIGLDVHRAARIMSAGHGGQVLLSQTTRDLVDHMLPDDVRLRDVGEHRLKDLKEPSHLYQLVITGLRADFPPLRTLGPSSSRYALPTQPTSLVGREQEIIAVSKLLNRGDVRLLTLIGTAGVGKTRLALSVAERLFDQFSDGVYFVSLAQISNAEEVVPAIIQKLGIREETDQSLLDSVKSFLHEKQVLLLLDNFEQVLHAAIIVADLLASCPRLKILVTSRAVLHVQAERVFNVPPLALPDLTSLAHATQPPDLTALSQNAAVALFMQRAQALKPHFRLTDANAIAIATICIRLDGIPLAIELAAARSKYFPPQILLRQLEQGLTSLAGGARDLPARQQTLRGAIAWSYELLTPEEQQVFRRLSVFMDGCSPEAAEQVCTAASAIEGNTWEIAEALVERNTSKLKSTSVEADSGNVSLAYISPTFFYLLCSIFLLLLHFVC